MAGDIAARIIPKTVLLRKNVGVDCVTTYEFQHRYEPTGELLYYKVIVQPEKMCQLSATRVTCYNCQLICIGDEEYMLIIPDKKNDKLKILSFSIQEIGRAQS